MYVSSLPISPAAAAANATRAAIMRRAHALVRLNTHLPNSYAERLAYFIRGAWADFKKERREAAAQAERIRRREETITRHRNQGLVTWLEGTWRDYDLGKLKEVVAYNPALNKKHFVTIPHEYHYITAKEGDYRVNLVAKLQKNVVYGRVNGQDKFDYIMLNSAGNGVVQVRFEDVAHLVPTQVPAENPHLRVNKRNARARHLSHDDEDRDSELDEPTWQLSDDLYVENYE